MAYVLLSGGAYGADWLPLILPLVCVLLLLYAGDLSMRYYKKWRLRRENKLLRELTGVQKEDELNSEQ